MVTSVVNASRVSLYTTECTNLKFDLIKRTGLTYRKRVKSIGQQLTTYLHNF